MKTKITLLLLSAALVSFVPVSPGLYVRPVDVYTSSPLKWKSTEIDLGSIPQSKPVEIQYELTNTGNEPIVITSVVASCGCTAAQYDKNPILAGATTVIKATFNAAAKGAFRKTITVTTSAEETPKTLTFTGTVI
jgi:hypothetical protein